MTNIQAAFLYDQLNDLDTILNKKHQLFTNYTKMFVGTDVIYNEIETGTEHSTWMLSMYLKGLHYAEFESFMEEKDIQVRPLFYDIRKHRHLENIKIEYEEIDTHHGFMIPSFPELSREQQEYIVNCIKEYLVTKK